MTNRFRRTLAASVAAVLTVVPFSALAEADKPTESGLRAMFVQDVVNHLSVYAGYDSVTPHNLYKEGLKRAIEKHPEIYEDVLTGILESIDENSEYYNAEDTKILREELTGTIVGIGITFQMCNEGVDVRSVIPDTPASNGGLQVGDVIVSADGNELAGMNSDTASSFIKGEKGTTVRIGIKREGVDNIIYVDLVRDEIIGTSVTSETFEEGEKKLQYITVYGFIGNTAEMFKAALDDAAAKGISNIIIDLRDNGGGIFDQAILMADHLLPQGSTITTQDQRIDVFDVVYKAELPDTHKFNTVVLVNENSASASEVLSAALRENDCAILIGQQTYGKGTIQTVADLAHGDSMKFTIGFYLTPLGNNIHKIGLTPDYIVENTVTPFDISKYPRFEYANRYKIGDTNAEIKTAKEMLKEWGLFDGEVNEIFDSALEKAVFSFQTATGLYPYGVLDITTQHQLYTRLEKSKVVHDDQLAAAFAEFEMTYPKD